MYAIFSLITLLLNLFFEPSHTETAKEFIPTFSISQNPTHSIPKGQEYTFGYLEVLENRSSNSQKTIKIPVYIFKSRNPNPKKDPIIYTVGGPGSTTMPSAQYMNSYQYLDDRDFILVEQRGNYYAQPHLDCPEWSKAIYQSNLPGFDLSLSDSLFAAAAKSCKDRLLAKNIDLNGYNTNEIAADINDLVKVLGIKEYNLLTISYSTKIVQVLMRDYPERIRSVVMDSPLPLEVNYEEESVGNLLQSLHQTLSDCEENENCNQAFPNLKKDFLRFLRDKTEDPLVIAVTNPMNGEEEIFHLKGADLITVFSSASTADVPNIPLEIHKLLAGDLSTVKEQLSNLLEGPGSGSGLGMRLSVWCAEESPFNSREAIELEKTKYPEVAGLSPEVFTAEICVIWGVQKVAEKENQAIKSDIPVLLISGEYDHETPVKWAVALKHNLSNQYHLIFKGWKHTPTTNWANPCAMQAANDFFNNPSSKPSPPCFEQIKTPNFNTGS
ncbi:alpha/beta hydrolase [Algoriphagus sp.]|uniref:alpha/beta fold hydrolase n=1 Tax=Algoriphagus sp. TaxID=1872435 RepID=UPI0025EEB9E9|nr:alpha/beta hydrolase [Algoriphagus sp.]